MILREIKNIYTPVFQVEYLESTGTQYIDTEVYANLDTSVDVKFCFTEIFPDNAIISADSGNSASNSFTLEYFTNDSETIGIVFSVDGASAVAYKGTTERALAWFEVNASKRGLVINNVFYPSQYQPSNFTSNYSLFIFAYGRRGVPIIFGKSRITYLKIYNKGTLIRDFIPVRVGSVGYFYDRVSKRLFGNKGTGNFVLGQDVDSELQQIYQNSRLIEGVDYETADWLKGDIPISTYMMNLPINSKNFEFQRDFIQIMNTHYFITSSDYIYYISNYPTSTNKLKIQVWNNNTQATVYTDGFVNQLGIHTIVCNDSNVQINNRTIPWFGGECNIITFSNAANYNQHTIHLTSSIKVDGVTRYVPCQLLKSIPRNLDAQCKERVAGECGMIDLISGKFYGNVASSGTFTVENDNNE